MKMREYGKTGRNLSIVGFPGTLLANHNSSYASSLVSQAIDRGINYFDVGPTYGNAQELLGQALKPYRDSVFLACKTNKRTKKEATSELRNSLRLLQTNYIDLYQIHEVTTMKDVRQAMGEGGAIEAFIEAKEEGLIKHIGFSAHSEETALELIDQYEFDSVLFPINWVCWHQANFGPRVLKKAVEKEVALLALKSLAKRLWKRDEKRTWPKVWYEPADIPNMFSLALRFALSLPITSAVGGGGHPELLWMMCDVAEKFKPLTKEEEAFIAEKSKGIEPIVSYCIIY